MSITPVNVLNFGNRAVSSVSFSGKNKTSQGSENIEHTNSKSNILAKVPVAVLIGLTPALMQSSVSRDAFQKSEVEQTMVAEPSVRIDTIPEEPIDTTKTFKLHKSPFGLPQMKNYRMKDVRSFDSNNRKYIFVMAAERGLEEGCSGIDKVFIFPKGLDADRIFEIPYVNKLIYHNVGKESFYSAEILTPYKYDNKGKGNITYTDVRLPNDIGKAISNLVNDKSKYENRTLLQQDTVTTTKLQPKEVIVF